MSKNNTKSFKKGILIIGIALVLIIAVIFIIQFKKNKTHQILESDKELDSSHYSIDTLSPTLFYWKAEHDTATNKEFLNRGSLLDSISKTPHNLIGILNKRPAKSKIEFISINEDTLTISILDEKYLIEQMGSTGAYCYLAETVFTLTEIKWVELVRIEMEHGSHASPGIYRRNDFENMIKGKEAQ